MSFSENDKRAFVGKIVIEYGLQLSLDDPMLPVLYMIHSNTVEQQKVLEDLKNNIASNSKGKKIILTSAEAASAFVIERHKTRKNFIEYGLIFLAILLVTALSSWYFISIQKKYEAIYKYSPTTTLIDSLKK